MKPFIIFIIVLMISSKCYSQHPVDSLEHEALELFLNLISTLDTLDMDIESIGNCKTVFGGNVDYIPDSTIQIQGIFNSWVRLSQSFIIIHLPGMDGLIPPYNKDVYYVYNIASGLWETIPGLIYNPDSRAESLLRCALIDLDYIISELR